MKLTVVLALLIALVATGCSAGRSDSPTREGGEQGYPEVTKNLTQIPPDQRTIVPEVAGPGTGQRGNPVQ